MDRLKALSAWETQACIRYTMRLIDAPNKLVKVGVTQAGNSAINSRVKQVIFAIINTTENVHQNETATTLYGHLESSLHIGSLFNTTLPQNQQCPYDHAQYTQCD